MNLNKENKFQNKKILVLGGSFQHCKVVEAAHKLGMLVYVTDYLTSSPAKDIADIKLNFDVKDVNAIVKYCRNEKINGVINTSLDPCQIPYQMICEKLGLPCFGNQEQFRILTDKNIFKSYCKKYGVGIVETYSEEDLIKLASTNCLESILPIVVKPSNSRGSRGQTICYEKNEIEKAIKQARENSSEKEIVIENYMKNVQDFTVAYLFMNGTPILVRTGDRYVGSEMESLSKVAIASSSPSRYSRLFIDKAHNNLVNMLKGIGIKNGPVFFQGFVDGEVIRFYDPGFRFSGGEYERLFFQATNLDLIKMLVEFAILGHFEEQIDQLDMSNINGKRIMQLCPTLKPGKIERINGISKILENESIVSFFPRYSAGDVVPNCSDVRRRYAEICILSEDLEKEQEIIQFIQDNLFVQDSQGNNLLYNCVFNN